MKARNQSLVLLWAAALLFADNACGDTIALRSSVRLRLSADVITLGEIADLEGPAAIALANVPIALSRDVRSVMEIPVRDVRSKLDEAGVHWGKVNLSGRSVVVRAGRDFAAAAPMAMTSLSLDQDQTAKRTSRGEQAASALLDQPTVRGSIANLIVSNLHCKADDLRLSFDSDDADILDARLDQTRFEIQPLSNFNSDRIDLTVRLWDSAKVRQSQIVSVRATLRVKAATLAIDVQKDQVIAESDIVETEQWLPLSQASQMVSRVGAVGRMANQRMKAGEVLRDRSTRREMLIKRGELAIVRCLVGGAVISLQAEARTDGAEGEVIEFRKQGERETFRATVTNRGEAVLDLSRRNAMKTA